MSLLKISPPKAASMTRPSAAPAMALSWIWPCEAPAMVSVAIVLERISRPVAPFRITLGVVSSASVTLAVLATVIPPETIRLRRVTPVAPLIEMLDANTTPSRPAMVTPEAEAPSTSALSEVGAATRISAPAWTFPLASSEAMLVWPLATKTCVAAGKAARTKMASSPLAW